MFLVTGGTNFCTAWEDTFGNLSAGCPAYFSNTTFLPAGAGQRRCDRLGSGFPHFLDTWNIPGPPVPAISSQDK